MFYDHCRACIQDVTQCCLGNFCGGSVTSVKQKFSNFQIILMYYFWLYACLDLQILISKHLSFPLYQAWFHNIKILIGKFSYLQFFQNTFILYDKYPFTTKVHFDHDQNKENKGESVLRGTMLLLILIYSSIQGSFSIIKIILSVEMIRTQSM